MEQVEPKRIVERIRPPGDPLQELARRGAAFNSPPNWKQRWFRTAPETRLAIAVIAVAPLVLACVAVAAAVTR